MCAVVLRRSALLFGRFFGEWEEWIGLTRFVYGISLVSSQTGGFSGHYHPSISHRIFMCIVGTENMLLFKVSYTSSFISP